MADAPTFELPCPGNIRCSYPNGQCYRVGQHSRHDWRLSDDVREREWKHCAGVSPEVMDHAPEILQCARRTAHHDHRWGEGVEAHCPGVNAGEGHDVEDSPLPCRCYFINGHRNTADCTVGHTSLGDAPFSRDEANAAITAYVNLDDHAKARIGAFLVGYLTSQAERNAYTARTLRAEVPKWGA